MRLIIAPRENKILLALSDIAYFPVGLNFNHGERYLYAKSGFLLISANDRVQASTRKGEFTIPATGDYSHVEIDNDARGRWFVECLKIAVSEFNEINEQTIEVVEV